MVRKVITRWREVKRHRCIVGSASAVVHTACLLTVKDSVYGH